MTDINALLSRQSSVGRWSGIGPYYAMFPVPFAFHAIEKYTQPGDFVLDPFAGRASSIYAAAALGRTGCGIEINRVGWLYGKVKLNPAAKDDVENRIDSVARYARRIVTEEVANLPEFFSHCYAPDTLRFLLAARRILQWKKNSVDATLMAIILVHLHGKAGSAFSNQMRQGKAMSPQYSIRWWQAKGFRPPEMDPSEFLKRKLVWRYAKGTPIMTQSAVIFGDSSRVLSQMRGNNPAPQYDFLFTSPPYYAITDYHYDQWLRLWMLGNQPLPLHGGGDSKGRFQSQLYYYNLLRKVFSDSAQLLKPGASLLIRTDARPFTFSTTINALREAFPDKTIDVMERPFEGKTQTELYGDKTKKPGERDILLKPK